MLEREKTNYALEYGTWPLYVVAAVLFFEGSKTGAIGALGIAFMASAVKSFYRKDDVLGCLFIIAAITLTFLWALAR